MRLAMGIRRLGGGQELTGRGFVGGATSTRTPSGCSCRSCPLASSADTAALSPLLRSRPTIGSASVRLATTATGTVTPSLIHEYAQVA